MTQIQLKELAGIEGKFGVDDTAQDGTRSALIWHSASRTDVGRVRHVNEDALLDAPAQRLWIVADGMGGDNRGHYASRAVVQQFQAFARQGSLSASLLNLESRLLDVNEKCLNAYRGKRSGSTVAAILAHGDYCFCLWAGDSRIYRLRDQQLDQLTADHTVAQEKLARGEITAEEKEDHPSAHVLTRAVGIHRSLQLDLRYSSVQPGDRYLICSDGLYNPLELPDIHALLGKDTAQNTCNALVDLAMLRGGRDNITAIVVDVSQGQASHQSQTQHTGA